MQHRGGRGGVAGQGVLEVAGGLGRGHVGQGAQAGGQRAAATLPGRHLVAGSTVVPGEGVHVIGVPQRPGQALQSVGQRRVQAAQPPLANPVQQGLAQQRVQEDVPAAGPRLDDPALDGGAHRGHDPIGRTARGDQRLGAETRAGHRGGDEAVAVGAGEGGQPGAEQGADVVGGRQRVGAGRVEVPRAPQRGEQPGVQEPQQVRDDREWRTVGTPGHVPDELGGNGRAGQPGGDQRLDGGRLVRRAVQFEVSGHGVRRARAVPLGQQHQQRQVRQVGHEPGEHLPAARIEPLCVVAEQHQSAVGLGQLGQERGDRREQVIVPGLAGAGLADQRPEPGAEPRDQRRAGDRGGVADPPLGAGPVRAVQQHDRLQVTVDRGAQGGQRHCLVLGARGVQRRHVGGERGGLLGQPGAPGTGRSPKDGDAAASGQRSPPAIGQALALLVAPAQRPVRRRRRSGTAARQRRQHRGGVRVAVVRVLGQQAGHDPGHGRVEPGAQLDQIRHRRGQVQPQQLADVLGLERQPPGQAFEEHHAERVQIGPAVDRALEHPGLLRRGVEEGSDRPVVVVRFRPEQRETEVDQFGRVSSRHHDVAGLHVPVDQADPVGGGQAAAELAGELDDPLGGERTVREGVGERAAGQVLQDHGRRAAEPAGGVDERHARVVDAGEQRGLALEGGEQAGIVGVLRDRSLQRVGVAAPPGPVHGGERAPAQFFLDHQTGQVRRPAHAVLVTHWHPLRSYRLVATHRQPSREVNPICQALRARHIANISIRPP